MEYSSRRGQKQPEGGGRASRSPTLLTGIGEPPRCLGRGSRAAVPADPQLQSWRGGEALPVRVKGRRARYPLTPAASGVPGGQGCSGVAGRPKHPASLLTQGTATPLSQPALDGTRAGHHTHARGSGWAPTRRHAPTCVCEWDKPVPCRPASPTVSCWRASRLVVSSHPRGQTPRTSMWF